MKPWQFRLNTGVNYKTSTLRCENGDMISSNHDECPQKSMVDQFAESVGSLSLSL